MSDAPIPMILPCPKCGKKHVDEGEWATKLHRTHLCAFCRLAFRPAHVSTVGVERLPSVPVPSAGSPVPVGCG